MAGLTDEQVIFLQTQLGLGEDPADLQSRYDRLGDVVAVAREVLEIRIADLLATPEQFNVSGVYSQSTKEQLAALQKVLLKLGDTESDPVGGTARLVGPYRSPYR